MEENNKPNLKNGNLKQAFKRAVGGCWYAFTTQKNFPIHLSIVLLVILLALWLRISYERFLFLIFAIFLGLTIEMVNTIVEKTVDLITERYHPTAKIVKDLSAGIMLIVSIGLALIGFLILFPPLWQKIILLI